MGLNHSLSKFLLANNILGISKNFNNKILEIGKFPNVFSKKHFS